MCDRAVIQRVASGSSSRLEPRKGKISAGSPCTVPAMGESYLHDVERLGYADGRLTPASTMTPEDVAGWTEAIPDRQGETVADDPQTEPRVRA